jgi:hypothetical protein
VLFDAAREGLSISMGDRTTPKISVLGYERDGFPLGVNSGDRVFRLSLLVLLRCIQYVCVCVCVCVLGESPRVLAIYSYGLEA